MSPPKLKIRLPAGCSDMDVCELEQARFRLNFDDGVIAVEGQTVHSYDELVELATRDAYKDQEFIEVVVLQIIEGG